MFSKSQIIALIRSLKCGKDNSEMILRIHIKTRGETLPENIVYSKIIRGEIVNIEKSINILKKELLK